ncbi:Tim17/Tim22/Tim23/Pmp24 family-domain-containing protein [Pyronema domesticum]|uniref:Mitochondrial import inner membrane translocase subunit TIM22 n=1 Tax=Pyronema omphalodes (strain CBS 100304) TaxID=1076935 RepID=U4L2E8_PYROM|nr:Tim17/Tim22/Tim23/Pmp24 family-domain-containing protein [Pyronema domesticum]CCX10481.1 Similar to Mitochondrial import inner membrane translocase subunit tim22; acc. no. Q2UAP8 [Pyronema omphalodes CBS 100304]
MSTFGGFNPYGKNQNMSPDDVRQQQIIKGMQMAMESCPAKLVLSGGAGFALGGVFGLFMASMSYDTPMSGSGAQTITSLPLKQQLKEGFKDMGKRSWSSAKNFGMVGAIFSGTECCIEGFRAKNDLYNGVAAGCLTGGALAASAGPQAAAIGCAGFAAFSAAIDYYLREM